MSSAIKKRSLILTFDAFGTLIKPRIPIVDQYREEAAKFGVKFKKAEHLSAIIGKEFKTAFNIVKQQNPNFGAGDRAIGYEKWWHLVIQRTLEPHITTSIPPELAPSLLKRFSSAEGYELHHDVLHFLRSVSSNNPPWRYPPLVTIPPGSPTPSQDTPMTIFGILSNGDPRISLILDSLGISKYFSFQLLSYQTGHVKPSREAFRLARQTGLMIGKGDPTYKTKDPHTGKELRKTWLGWDFVHVGDDIFEDWLAARKLPDVQPVWVDRERLGLSVTDLEKFRKRGEDKFPMQMLHMAEGMKGWDTKKMSAAERRELMELMKTNANSMQCMHELLNSTISDLTELPCLFRDIDPPPESADVPIALADPDKWDEELQKWRDEKSRANLEAQEKDAKMRLLMREKRGPRQKTFSFGRKSDGRGKHSRGSTRGNEERARENVERIEGNMRNAGVWGDAQRPEPQPEFLGMAYRRIKLSSNMRSDMRSDMHGKKREKMHGHKRGKMTHKRGKTGGNRRK